MTNRLGFTLWRKQTARKLKSKFVMLLQQFTFSTFLNLFIAAVGIYLAFQANKISMQSNQLAQTQFEMQKTDTSQQSQLNKLTQILEEVQQERILSNTLNKKTDNLNNTAKIQSDIIAQQLLLSRRFETKDTKNDSLAQDGNMLSIITTFNKLFDVETSREAIFIDKYPVSKRTAIIQKVRTLLEKELSNKFILNNKYLRYVWFDFYEFASSIEYDFKIYDIGTRSTIKSESENTLIASEFSTRFLDFLNKMLKPKNSFIESFKTNARNEYMKDPK